MAISDGITIDATTLQPVASPTTVPSTPPIVVQQVAPNARRDSQNDDPKNPAARALNFRAVLNATTFSGIAQSTSTAPSGADPVERAAKLPDSEPTELSAGETAGLFAASQVTRGSGASPDRTYQLATQRYVQAFFAATPTFARPGESLELKA